MKSAGSFIRDTWATLRGKPSTFPAAWADISGKPSTYPPTLPIAQSGVTNLVSDLAARQTAAQVQTAITTAINALVNGAPAALDTLIEIADRFAAEDSDQAAIWAAVALRLRVDAAQSLTAQQQTQGRSNLGLGSAATRDESYFVLASAMLQLATAAGLAGTTSGTVGTSSKAAREDHTHPSMNQLLGTVNIAESGLTLLALSVRRVNIAVAGAVVGGNYAVFPVNAVPAGFGIVDAVCTTAGTITFGMLVPIITGSYSIPVRVVRVLTP
jgi:hypothetical protein